MLKEKVCIFFKGVIIGASMLLPGVSGGTTAIILGVYNDLLKSVSSFFKSPKKNSIFLFLIGIGGIAGVLTFSRVSLFFIQNYQLPMNLLFAGIVLGSVPSLLREAGVIKINLSCVFFICIGLVLACLSSFIPQSLHLSTQTSIPFIYLFAVGIILSVALILPGISTSYMLLLLGIYQPVLHAVEILDLRFLSALAVGIICGIILFTKLLAFAMTKFPKQTYTVIIGFVIASLKDVIPQELSVNVLLSLPMTIIGFSAVYLITRKIKE